MNVAIEEGNNGMDRTRAAEMLAAERERITTLLTSAAQSRADDNDAERDAGDGDPDGAQPLEHEALDAAVMSSLQERLAAVDRADARVANGTYGLSVRSGLPIPDERLQVDPAADLTVEEARTQQHRY